MFDLIIFILIIYFVYRSFYNKNITFSVFKEALQQKGYGNIIQVSQDASQILVTADYNGENYLFKLVKANGIISSNSIIAMNEYAVKNHYHNLILVPGNSILSNSVQSLIKNYNIQIWNENEFKTQKTAETENIINSKYDNINSFIKSNDLQDPIQDGSKVNSLFGNLFGNKIERL